ncbi:MAG TPA: YwqG family protein [Candidatus Acidoferrum sp.]
MNSKEGLRRKLFDAGMSKIADEVAAVSREAFRIQTSAATDETLPIGASKLGGLPDLPANIAWPNREGAPLAFIGQINLREIPSPSPLSQDGIVSFFYDNAQSAWGFDPKDQSSFRVLFFPMPDELRRAHSPVKEKPSSLLQKIKGSSRKRSEFYFQIFAVRRLAFVPFQSIPDPCAKLLERPLRELDDQDMYANFFDEYSHQGPAHQLLGWPKVIQNEMELECQMVTNGIYMGDTSGYKHPRRAELEKSKQDWILLLQVDSDDDAQMMWGDAGMLYFWIRRQNLERADFDSAWCILQCY